MGLLSGILGNASKANTNHVEQELQKILLPNEDIEYAYSLVRDIIAFTKYRMIVVDKQGVTGKKISYRTIPYKSISRFEVETAGHQMVHYYHVYNARRTMLWRHQLC